MLFRNNICKVLSYFSIFLPVLAISLFAVFILSAKQRLGHWPQLYDPNPYDLGLVFYYDLFYMTFQTLWVNIPLSAIMLVIAHYQSDKKSKYMFLFGGVLSLSFLIAIYSSVIYGVPFESVIWFSSDGK